MNRQYPPDVEYMQLALTQAARGLGRTAPNPPVGCIIVQGQQIVGRGFHPQAGQPHAEIFALREAGTRARGATAYVTLEPCSHTGRTPPCADALIAAGIARVVVATSDPNPLVSGRGLAKLRAAGVEVLTGVLGAQAAQQQAGFRSVMTRGRPQVIYKYAMTLDGKVAATGEANGPVSGPQARARVMQWRNEADAVAVGIGTLLTDNPRLNTRDLPGGRDARPVIFDRAGRTPPDALALRAGAVVVTASGTDYAAPQGVTVLQTDSLSEALSGLGTLGINTLLLEGGPTLAGAFYAANLIDELRVFIAPKLLGAGLPPLLAAPRSMHAAAQLRRTALELVGQDILWTGEIQKAQ